MRKALFNIDGGQVYVGYTNGYLWNGWATPYFTYKEVRRIQTEWNNYEPWLVYNEVKDEFHIHYEGDDEPYIWKGEDIKTVDGIQHLYGIGAYSHIWDELDDDAKWDLAREVVDLMYGDELLVDEEPLLEVIINEFADIDTFAKIYTIMHGNMDASEIYYELLKCRYPNTEAIFGKCLWAGDATSALECFIRTVLPNARRLNWHEQKSGEIAKTYCRVLGFHPYALEMYCHLVTEI